MAEDREQERAEEREGVARPVTAAARRERRASARQAAVAGEDGQAAKTAAVASGTARPRRVRDAQAAGAEEQTGTSTQGTAKKGRPTPARDRRTKRPSAFKRATRFLREVVSELRKVIWPTRKQQFTYTLVVLVFVAVIVALVFGLDTLFAKGVFWVFG